MRGVFYILMKSAIPARILGEVSPDTEMLWAIRQISKDSGRRGELVAIFADGQQQQGNQIKAETERTFVA